MSYVVSITTEAVEELESAYAWLATQSPKHAPKWYNDFIDALISLEDNPARCAKTAIGGDVRQLLFGDKRHAYRIFFTIRGMTVYVQHIRHASRQT